MYTYVCVYIYVVEHFTYRSRKGDTAGYLLLSVLDVNFRGNKRKEGETFVGPYGRQTRSINSRNDRLMVFERVTQ